MGCPLEKFFGYLINWVYNRFFLWGNEAFFLGNPENGTKKVKKPKGKETIYTDFLNKFQFKKLDTIEDPHDKHTFEDQCCSRVTPLNKLCGCCFLLFV